MLKGMFKKTAYIHISGGLKNSPQERKNVHTPEVPEGLWQKCPQCHGDDLQRGSESQFFCVSEMWSSFENGCTGTAGNDSGSGKL